MGSNNWLKIASAAALAVSTLGPISDARAQLDGVKGHIDIPEIARKRTGKPSSNPGDVFAGVIDEYGNIIVTPPIGINPDDRLPEPVEGGAGEPGNIETLMRSFSNSPVGVLNPVGLDAGIRTVPAPSVLAPLALLAIAGRRRR